VIAQRNKERPEGSYTTRLLESGVQRIAQKVGEEAVETALAAVAGDSEDLLNESADLLYHLLVLLRSRGQNLPELVDTLRERHGG
jgi:phosphoribosyl-ATP pyrophosphohydrolase/phosphoribosyl-AMP cyclohydrolase